MKVASLSASLMLTQRGDSVAFAAAAFDSCAAASRSPEGGEAIACDMFLLVKVVGQQSNEEAEGSHQRTM